MNSSPNFLVSFSTCDLCDGHKTQLGEALRVLPPVFKAYGGQVKFAGPVVTVRCFEDNSLVKAALDEPGWLDTPAGRVACVLVVEVVLRYAVRWWVVIWLLRRYAMAGLVWW